MACPTLHAGDGTRVADDWRLTSATGALGQSFYVRARGYYTDRATSTGSGSIVESIRKVNIACPTLSATPLPAGVAGLPYSATLTASGTLGVVTFATASTLPTGVTLVERRRACGHADTDRGVPSDGDRDRRLERLRRLPGVHADTINPQTPLTLTLGQGDAQVRRGDHRRVVPLPDVGPESFG